MFSKPVICITLCKQFWSNLEVFRMEIQNASTTSSKSNQLRNVNTARWMYGNVTTQPWKINNRNSEVIAFFVNAGMNVTANNFYISIQERSFFVWRFCFIQLKFCWIYMGNIFLKFRVIDGEYIVKISRVIIKHVYEVTTFRFVKFRHKVPMSHTLCRILFNQYFSEFHPIFFVSPAWQSGTQGSLWRSFVCLSIFMCMCVCVCLSDSHIFVVAIHRYVS